MNNLVKNRNLNYFLISFLIFLATVVIIFSFIGVSEGATNKDTANKNLFSKDFISKDTSDVVSDSDSNRIETVIDDIKQNNSNSKTPYIWNYSSGSNESENVLLEYGIVSSNIVMTCGGAYLYLDVFMYYKGNASPLPNQAVIFKIGDEIHNLTTNENGMIHYLYYPYTRGLVNFTIMFNGSKILDNGLSIDLEPVSVYGEYYMSEYSPPVITVFNRSDYIPFEITINSRKNDSIVKSNDFNGNISEYSFISPIITKNSQTAYAKMKKTGIPLMLLLLFLIATFSILYRSILYRKRSIVNKKFQ